jgi:phospholipase/carboxylesterase
MSYGFTWFDGWPPSGESMVVSRGLILEFFAQVLERYPTPAGKAILGGFSQGAMMALDAGFRTPEPLAAIVAMSGALYEADLPAFAARRDTPLLLIHGTEDDMIPVLAARRARRVLEQHGLSPQYHEFLMGHQVTEESVAVVRTFLREVFDGD